MAATKNHQKTIRETILPPPVGCVTVGIIVNNNSGTAPDADQTIRPNFANNRERREYITAALLADPDTNIKELADKCGRSYAHVLGRYHELFKDRPRNGKRGRRKSPARESFKQAIIDYSKAHPLAAHTDIAAAIGCDYDIVGTTLRAQPGYISPAKARRNAIKKFAVANPMVPYETIAYQLGCANVNDRTDKHRNLRIKLCEYADSHQWLTVKALAERFKITPALCTQQLMVRERTVPDPSHYHIKDKFRSFRNPKSKRVVVLHKALTEHWTLQEIAHEFKVTRERARQLVKLFKEMHPELAEPGTIGCRAAAKELGITAAKVKALSLKYKIGRKRRKVPLFTAEHITELKGLLAREYGKACAVCGVRYIVADGYQRPTCGSTYCHNKYYRRPFVDISQESKSSQWMPIIPKLLAIRDQPTVYIPCKAATIIACVSQMQMQWLRIRKIIRTTPDPRGRMINGTVVSLYSLEDVRVIREHMLQNGSPCPSDASDAGQAPQEPFNG